MSGSRNLIAACCACAFFACASELSADQPWVNLVKDNDRLVAEESLGLGDTQEKRYAWGDLNNNGWIDLVVVRKQPWLEVNRQNVLFMNENGVLVDRTAQYASNVVQGQVAELTEDFGFLTPTSDADVTLVDVTNSGWLDVITAVAYNDGAPKHIGYPRVYINLGNDGSGDWLGLRFENARIPEMLTASGLSDHNPRFTAVTAGDVNGNGYADLWFGDSGAAIGPSQPTGADFDDRLLINQGAASPGYFMDMTSQAFSGVIILPGQSDPQFPVSSESWSAVIADVNGNGSNEIVKSSSLQQPHYVGIAYNLDGDGVFKSSDYYQAVAGMSSATYHITMADLNNNDRLDMILSDAFIDRYMLNLSTQADGTVHWSPQTLLPGPTAFASRPVAVDLDNSGWNDIIIPDVAYGIPGCNRETQIYRNRQIPSPGADFVNASNIIPASERQGVFDVAAFDLTGNGMTDLVLGRCSGTDIWVNDPPQQPCPGDLTGSGSVDVFDLLGLLAAWGPNPGHPADLNGDNEVNVFDLLALLAQWGPCP